MTFSLDTVTMDEHTSIFTQLPIEVLVDLLLLTDAKSISQFYGANTTHKKLFTRQNGLWQLLSCKICSWSAADVKLIRRKNNSEDSAIDWHKEFRVVSFFDSKIRNAELTHNNLKPRPPLLQTVAKNHFRVDNCLPDDFGVDYAYCALQATDPLYPLPLGNFTVAYYEVELLKLGQFDFVVGAAQDGYVGYVGLGRSSFSFGSDPTSGIFYLSSEFVSEESQSNPLYFLHIGDIIGFGIDFSKRSVFWTKNGEFMFESTVDAMQNPILNINSLHATVSMDNHEFKANFGSKPFAFDILGYQKKHSAATELSLYSNTIMPHLCSFQDSDSFTGKFFKAHSAFYPLASDFTPPKFTAHVPPLLYMVTYCRNDPNFKETEVSTDLFMQLQTCRAVCAWAKTLQELKEPVHRSTQRFMQTLATMFGQNDYEEKSWSDKVMTIARLAEPHVMNLIGELVHVTIESTTTEYAFTGLAPDWAVCTTAFHQLIYGDTPPGHYTKQAAIDLLQEQAGEQLNTVDLVIFAFETILRLRTSVMESVANQRCMEIVAKQIKEHRELMPIYNNDAHLIAKIKEMYSELRSRVDKSNHQTELEKRLGPIYLYNNLRGIDEPGSTGNSFSAYFVLCGIYKLKIDPTPFPTKEEYLNEVKKQLRVLMTDEDLLRDFLQYCKDHAECNFDNDSFVRAVIPLQYLGLDPALIKGPDRELRDAILMMKSVAMKSTNTQSNAKHSSKVALGVGIVAGLAAIGVGLGYYLFRKKFK